MMTEVARILGGGGGKRVSGRLPAPPVFGQKLLMVRYVSFFHTHTNNCDWLVEESSVTQNAEITHCQPI